MSEGDARPPRDVRLIRRVAFRNYKSIAACDVELPNPCFLVGPNGSGKSNFLDAMRFVAEALRTSLEEAVRSRGGIDQICRRGANEPPSFGMRIDFDVPLNEGFFAFDVEAERPAGFVVRHEECHLEPKTEMGAGVGGWYEIQDGRTVLSPGSPPVDIARDRLSLGDNLGREPSPFRSAAKALAAMGFYQIDPGQLRELQVPERGNLLQRDGSNLVAVLAALESRSPLVKERIEEYLAHVVPGLASVTPKILGPKQTLEFRQQAAGGGALSSFDASNMSDGTLRALGILVALFQHVGHEGPIRRFVAIEEPEMALHPGAVGILLDAVRDAADEVQVVVTSHSPDLLDHREIQASSILAVDFDGSATRIAPLDEAIRDALRDQLYTPGELLRMGQLRASPARESIAADQRSLVQGGD